jgi:hypothetical protein
MRSVLPHDTYPEPVLRLRDADPGPLEGLPLNLVDRASPFRIAQRDGANDAPRRGKIPCECVVCGTTLRFCEMEAFVEECEASGADPIAVALSRDPQGIPCTACSRRALVEHIADTGAAQKRAAEAWLAWALATCAIEDEAPSRARQWDKARRRARAA